MHEALVERNFAAVQQAVNLNNTKTDKNADDIQKLQAAVSALAQQVQMLTQAVNGMRVMMMGRGPTA